VDGEDGDIGYERGPGLHAFPGGHFYIQAIAGVVCRIVAAELDRMADTAHR
jgi:surfactin synthase thioesterase subunit